MMVGCASAMPESEKCALEEWERANLDGCTVSTSDWPGWKKYIGERPQSPPKITVKKKPIPYRLRWAVFKRDGFKCVDCGSQDDLSADHVLPECKGGLTTFENLRTRCRKCNSKKGRRLTAEIAVIPSSRANYE